MIHAKDATETHRKKQAETTKDIENVEAWPELHDYIVFAGNLPQSKTW